MQASGKPQIDPLGLDGFLVRFSDQFSDQANRAALAFRSSVEALELFGLEETACSLVAVYIRFSPQTLSHATLRATLQALLAERDWFAAALPGRHRLWRVPTVYGGTHGPQLEEAAAMADLTPQEAIEQLSTARTRVMAIGFAPGFPYLGHLPEAWNLPRHTDLQTRVPAGALCLAIRQFVLFPTGSQTGWRHIAHTAFRAFRPDASYSFPLQPGDEMIFPAVPASDFAHLDADPTGNGGATCEVVE